MSPRHIRRPSAELIRRPAAARVAVGLAAVALAVIGWLEVGWFVTDHAELSCIGRDDATVTCTSTRYYRYRTSRHVVDGVLGVTVVEIVGESSSYELRLLRRGGRDGASLGPSYITQGRASRAADRLTSLVAVAPGEQLTERTIEPPSTVEVVILSLLMALLTVTVPFCAAMAVGLVTSVLWELWGWGRRRLGRLGRR